MTATSFRLFCYPESLPDSSCMNLISFNQAGVILYALSLYNKRTTSYSTIEALITYRYNPTNKFLFPMPNTYTTLVTDIIQVRDLSTQYPELFL